MVQIRKHGSTHSLTQGISLQCQHTFYLVCAEMRRKIWAMQVTRSNRHLQKLPAVPPHPMQPVKVTSRQDAGVLYTHFQIPSPPRPTRPA